MATTPAHSIGPPQPRAARSSTVRARPEAFAAVYAEHHQALYRYCRAILGHDEDARDALHNAMTRAYAALQTEDRDFELRPWLYRIAHNESISLLRTRRPTVELSEAAGVRDRAGEQLAGDREELALLRADLADLPDRQRSALVMRELSGLPHEEIAAALGVSAGAAKQAIFEARSALHQCREGREMACEDIRRMISDADGRVLRARRVRAHLRACPGCRDFAGAIKARPGQLAALAPPIPAAAGAAMLLHIAPGAKAAAAAAGGSAATGAGAGGAVATKAAVGLAIAACAAGGATVVRSTTSAPTHRAPAPAAVPHLAPATSAAGAPAPARSAAGGQPRAGSARKHHRDRAHRPARETTTAATSPTAAPSGITAAEAAPAGAPSAGLRHGAAAHSGNGATHRSAAKPQRAHPVQRPAHKKPAPARAHRPPAPKPKKDHPAAPQTATPQPAKQQTGKPEPAAHGADVTPASGRR